MAYRHQTQQQKRQQQLLLSLFLTVFYFDCIPICAASSYSSHLDHPSVLQHDLQQQQHLELQQQQQEQDEGLQLLLERQVHQQSPHHLELQQQNAHNLELQQQNQQKQHELQQQRQQPHQLQHPEHQQHELQRDYYPRQQQQQQQQDHHNHSDHSNDYLFPSLDKYKRMLSIIAESSVGSMHAVIVSTSRQWQNYRHMTNALSFYTLMKQQGMQDRNIILMIAGSDGPCSSRNRYPSGVYRHRDHHQNLYGGHYVCSSFIEFNDILIKGGNDDKTELNRKRATSRCMIGGRGWEGVEVDYEGNEVSVNALLGVLTGMQSVYTPQNKRMHSTRESGVVVFLSGHGGDGFLKFSDWEVLQQQQLAAAVAAMHALGRFKRLLLIAETCQAATLLSGVRTPHVLRISSSLKGESSYSYLGDTELGTALIDRWSHSVINFLSTLANHDAVGLVESYTQHRSAWERFDRYDTDARDSSHDGGKDWGEDRDDHGDDDGDSDRDGADGSGRTTSSSSSKTGTSSSNNGNGLSGVGVGRLKSPFSDLLDSLDASFLMSRCGVEEEHIPGEMSLTSLPLDQFFSFRRIPIPFPFTYPLPSHAAAENAALAAADDASDADAARAAAAVATPLLLWHSKAIRFYKPLNDLVLYPQQQQQQQQQQHYALEGINPNIARPLAILLASALCLSTAALLH